MQSHCKRLCNHDHLRKFEELNKNKEVDALTLSAITEVSSKSHYIGNNTLWLHLLNLLH